MFFFYLEFIRESYKLYNGIYQYENKLSAESSYYELKSEAENKQLRQSISKPHEAINAKSFYESIELLNSKVGYRYL